MAQWAVAESSRHPFGAFLGSKTFVLGATKGGLKTSSLRNPKKNSYHFSKIPRETTYETFFGLPP